MLLVAAISVLIYWWVSRGGWRRGSRGCGLLAAALYNLQTMLYNGYLVSREFPCSLGWWPARACLSFRQRAKGGGSSGSCLPPVW